MNDSKLLTVGSLSVARSNIKILNNINFSLLAGEVMTIIGPNGAGKSTLIAAIGGSLSAPLQAGSILLQDKNINDFSINEKAQRVAVLSQHTQLDFPFSVAEVIALGRIPHTTGMIADEEIVLAVSKLLELNHLLARSYLQLSGGEKQRVQLARVLAQLWRRDGRKEGRREERGEGEGQSQEVNSPPRLLLLDEPSAAFDLKNQRLLVNVIRAVAQQGVAIITVAHDLNLALEYSTKFLCLSEGSLVACGSADEVIRPEILDPVFSVKVKIIDGLPGDIPFVRFS